MKDSLYGILKTMRIILLATSLFFGGGATLDLVDNGVSDIQSIEYQLKHDSNVHFESNDNDGLEATGKGAISVLSLLLYFYAQNSQNKKTYKTFHSVQINLPFNMEKGNCSDEELSHYFQIHQNNFLKLIKDKLPDYFDNLCQIEEIKIEVKDTYLYVYVELKITTIENFEDFVKLIKKVVNDVCQSLFKEKLERIKKNLKPDNFNETINEIVTNQLNEAKLLR